MIYEPEIRLAENFVLKEVIEWPHVLPGMTDENKVKAIGLAKEALNPKVLVMATYQAIRLQNLRDALNRKFPDLKLSIRVTCWLRHYDWEIFKGRDGTSKHVTGGATDIVVIGAPPELHEAVMDFCEEYLKVLPGFTKRYDTFIHNDNRGLF